MALHLDPILATNNQGELRMNDKRVSIIRSVQTPLGFFVLVVLVTEVILGGIALRAEGRDITIIVIGMLVVLLCLVAAVYLMYRRDNGDHDGVFSDRKYDVFLSSVLAGFSGDDRMHEEQEEANKVVQALRSLGLTVYYAGESIKSQSDFEGTHLGAKRDLEALQRSRFFLMLYPEKVTSSVLFEAGYAYEHCENSVYIVRDRRDLPYLMRRLPEVHNKIHVFERQDTDSILSMINKSGRDLFAQQTP